MPHNKQEVETLKGLLFSNHASRASCIHLFLVYFLRLHQTAIFYMRESLCITNCALSIVVKNGFHYYIISCSEEGTKNHLQETDCEHFRARPEIKSL